MLYKKIMMGVILFNGSLFSLVPLTHGVVPCEIMEYKYVPKKKRGRPRKKPLIPIPYFSLNHEWMESLQSPAVKEMNELFFNVKSGRDRTPAEKECSKKRKNITVGEHVS